MQCDNFFIYIFTCFNNLHIQVNKFLIIIIVYILFALYINNAFVKIFYICPLASIFARHRYC